MNRTGIFTALALAAVIGIGYRAAEGRSGQAPPAAVDRKPDEAAIKALIAGFTAAFEKGDSAAAAAFVTSGAEIIPDDGPAVRGKDAIQKAFAAHFANTPRVKITLTADSLRFTSKDTAVEEGWMMVTPAGGGATTNKYSLLSVREDGKWLLAVIREWDTDAAVLSELDWLIGSWTAKRADAEVNTTYEWFGNKTFIRATFTIREKGKTLSGMQLIGTDAETGDLRTWVFEHDGAFGEGTLIQDGKKWVFEMATMLPDGGLITVANILVPLDKDSFTWQPLDLTIDGEQFGNLAPMKVTRVKK